MPHKRDQNKLLTTPQHEVKRCGTTKQEEEKPQKANVRTSMKNYKPVVTNSTSTSQPKTKKNNVQTTSTKY